MANIFKPKRSNVASSVPTTSNLADGEMAVNSADKKIYLRDGSEIVEVANNSSLQVSEYKILDDISSQFDGIKTQFTISSGSVNFLNSEITTAARLLISVADVVQQPDPTQTNGFYISGGTNITTDPIKLNFVVAPTTGQSFFGVAYGISTAPTTPFITPEQSIAYSIVFGV
jgi:hypothetical protein